MKGFRTSQRTVSVVMKLPVTNITLDDSGVQGSVHARGHNLILFDAICCFKTDGDTIFV